MTTFRIHQDVAAVEHNDDGIPLEGGQILPATITEVREYSARARFADGTVRYFMADSRDRLWREGGNSFNGSSAYGECQTAISRWRLVPLCCCDEPVTGTPVTDPDDRSGRVYCSEGCRTSDAEGAYEQHHPSGVAT
jgi:hypothetical protein